ncbi:hypothetical protein Vretimale_15399 [Volvox reticuliferus]|uniref:Uncharacterized protein n=1 Tax=Volvox reticuliferus TaxID=1737510 RepID=A0A8J4LVN9_9CHLO|nr:hypothetical protein Vretimale_15399 [Volvox reticuliferus]
MQLEALTMLEADETRSRPSPTCASGGDCKCRTRAVVVPARPVASPFKATSSRRGSPACADAGADSKGREGDPTSPPCSSSSSSSVAAASAIDVEALPLRVPALVPPQLPAPPFALRRLSVRALLLLRAPPLLIRPPLRQPTLPPAFARPPPPPLLLRLPPAVLCVVLAWEKLMRRTS